jgi:hypothetical protein
LIDEDVLAWKIATMAHGSEGRRPRHDWECPYLDLREGNCDIRQ